MPHILVVCTANICRSPVAEAMVRERLAENGLKKDSDWTVSSAGTWALESRSPAFFSQELMAERGLDISQKQAQIITRELLAQADLVLCMESGHFEALRAEFPDYVAKVHLFSEIAGKRYSIADPYGKTIVEFRAMVAEIDSLLEQGTSRLIEMAQNHA